MKRYHPHGDLSIYGTLVHMAQDWAMRSRLIHGQGNFGSIAGLPPAAHRYTEARLVRRRRGNARRPRPRHGRFHRQLRRQISRAAGPAVAVSEPARQRLRRHRRRHGDRNPAAQPRRNLRRPDRPDRQPRHRPAGIDGARPRPGFPDRRHHHGPAGNRRRLPDRPRQGRAAGPGRDRRGAGPQPDHHPRSARTSRPATGWPSRSASWSRTSGSRASPRCGTNRAPATASRSGSSST